MNKIENRDFCEKVGKNIERVRREKGLTQEQFGRLIGAKRSTVSAYEKNERSLRLEVLVTMADALDVNVLELLSDEVDRNAAQISALFRMKKKQRLCKIFLELMEGLMLDD